MPSLESGGDTFILTRAGGSLLWQQWDDVYIVYQPSSAETHVFNETTAMILKSLVNGQLTLAEVKERAGEALGVDPGELLASDFAFATMRLEELGLITRQDNASTMQ